MGLMAVTLDRGAVDGPARTGGARGSRQVMGSIRCLTGAMRSLGDTHMTQATKIVAIIMLIGTVATTGYGQTRGMSPDQMRMMGDQMRTMGDQMGGGKMTPDQMKMMGEHMQMMADRMKSGQMMTPDEMKMMNDHMQMMKEHMKGKN